MGLVDVGGKPEVERVAVAEGSLALRASTLAAVRERRVPKGDVVEAARAAALLAVKRTPDLLPHCHPIPITAVSVALEALEDPAGARLVARVEVRATYRTGVEMEALTGAAVALLTAWDMVKPLEKDEEGQYPHTRITDLRVVSKVKGGKGGIP